MGQGSSGEECEAYYVAWLLISHLLDNGAKLSEISSWSEEGVDDKVIEVMTNI